MTAAVVNLPPIEKYATYSVPILLSNTTGTAIDLTGCTADMMIRSNYKSAVVGELSTTNGAITIPTPTNGTLYLNFSPILTGSIAPGTYIYDLLVAFANGNVVRVIQGSVIVEDGVTHV